MNLSYLNCFIFVIGKKKDYDPNFNGPIKNRWIKDQTDEANDILFDRRIVTCRK